MEEEQEIYDDVSSVERAVGGVAKKLAMFENQGLKLHGPTPQKIEMSRKKGPPPPIDTEPVLPMKSKPAVSIRSPLGPKVATNEILAAKKRIERRPSEDSGDGVEGQLKSPPKIVPKPKPGVLNKPKPGVPIKPKPAKKTPSEDSSAEQDTSRTSDSAADSGSSAEGVIPPALPSRNVANKTASSPQNKTGEFKHRPLPQPKDGNNNSNENTIPDAAPNCDTFPKRAEAGKKIYELVPLPANTKPSPTKPTSLDNVDLSQFDADEIYDDLGDEDPSQLAHRPLPSVLREKPAFRPESVVSQIQEMDSDEEDELEGKSKDQVVMRKQALPTHPESEIYDDVGAEPDADEIYDEIG